MKTNLLTTMSVAIALSSMSLFSQETSLEKPAETFDWSKMDLPKISLSTGWISKDISNGIVYNPDPGLLITPQISYKGFYFKVDDYIDLTAYNNADHNSHYLNDRHYRIRAANFFLGYDYTINYFDFSPITLSTYWEYDYSPNKYKHTVYDPQRGKAYAVDGLGSNSTKVTQLMVGASLDNVLPKEIPHKLGISFQGIYELEKYGWHGNLRTNYTYQMCDTFQLGLRISGYWRDTQSNQQSFIYSDYVNGDSLNTIEVRPNFNWILTPHISLNGYIAGIWAIGSESRDAHRHTASNDVDTFWSGISLVFSL